MRLSFAWNYARILAAAALLTAFAPAGGAKAQTPSASIRGSFSEKNLDGLFQSIHRSRGKHVNMNLTITLRPGDARFEIRRASCWIQIIDRRSTPVRVIEYNNLDDWNGSGALKLSFKDVWEIQNVGSGKRPMACGGDGGVEAPNPGYLYHLNPVG
jgi:hypothetical protein